MRAAASALVVVMLLVAGGGCSSAPDAPSTTLPGPERPPVFHDPDIELEVTSSTTAAGDGDENVEVTDPVDEVLDVLDVEVSAADEMAALDPEAVSFEVSGDRRTFVVTYDSSEAAVSSLGTVVASVLAQAGSARGTPTVSGVPVETGVAVQTRFAVSVTEGDRTSTLQARIVAVSFGTRTLVHVLNPDDPARAKALFDAAGAVNFAEETTSTVQAPAAVEGSGQGT